MTALGRTETSSGSLTGLFSSIGILRCSMQCGYQPSRSPLREPGEVTHCEYPNIQIVLESKRRIRKPPAFGLIIAHIFPCYLKELL